MNKARHTATDDADDDAVDESSVQRIVRAEGAARPVASAPNSVFDAGRLAKEAAAPAFFDRSKIVIRSGVPKPAARNNRDNSYTMVIDRMKPGDSVELPTKQARGFYSAAKKCKASSTTPRQFSYRQVTAAAAAVWRDS